MKKEKNIGYNQEDIKKVQESWNKIDLWIKQETNGLGDITRFSLNKCGANKRFRIFLHTLGLDFKSFMQAYVAIGLIGEVKEQQFLSSAMNSNSKETDMS